MKQLPKNNFKNSKDEFDNETSHRKNSTFNQCGFGIPFLDDSLGGIAKDDLVLLGARTGIGKTELCTDIGLYNASIGKKVFFFALEADYLEIERRIKYKILCQLYKEDADKPKLSKPLNFRDWFVGKFDEPFVKYEEAMRSQFVEALGNFHTYYRENSFGVKEFIQQTMMVHDQADLIICDHIHYFDTETTNELKEMKEITKQIRDLVQINNTPIILVGHLRKADQSGRILPSNDDFHGSSDLVKMCTKSILLSPGELDGVLAKTYMRIGKNRKFGSVTKFVGECFYHTQANSYLDNYNLLTLSLNEKKLDKTERPPWW